MPTLRFFVMLEEWRKQRRHRDMFLYMLMQATAHRRLKDYVFNRLMHFLTTGELPEAYQVGDPFLLGEAIKRGAETLKRRQHYVEKFFGNN